MTGAHGQSNEGVERKYFHDINIAMLTKLYVESGNMLIMMMAHARISGDGSLLNLHVCFQWLSICATHSFDYMPYSIILQSVGQTISSRMRFLRKDSE